MKKLFAFVITMLLGASLTFAQAGGSTPGTKTAPGKKATTASTASGKKGKAVKKGHKGGKKSKKSSGGTTTTAPK
jgi:hypothetical protein